MAGSDSESDSECFESAEESLDEEEKIEEMKTGSKKNSNESESEVAEPVVSHNDRVNETLLERDVSNNSRTYRKRPERVKRTPSIPSSKIIPTRKQSIETISKTDVADVFFQDITTNLSKNINKSFHTLQQTSSSVKDLILSSLPLSSANEKNGFVYDDSLNDFQSSVDSDVANTIDGNFENDELKELPESIGIKNDKINDILHVQDKYNEKFISQKENLKINLENHFTSSSQVLNVETIELVNPAIGPKSFKSEELENEDVHSVSKLISSSASIPLNDKSDVIKDKESVKKFLSQNEAFTLKVEEIKSNIYENLFEKQKALENAKFSGPIVTEIFDNAPCDSQMQNFDDNVPEEKYFSVITNTTDDKKNKETNISETCSDKNEETTKKNIDSCSNAADFNKIQEQQNLADEKIYEPEAKVDESKHKDEKSGKEISESDFNTNETTEEFDENNDGWDDFDFSDNEIQVNKYDDLKKHANLDKSNTAENNKEKQEISTLAFDSFKSKSDMEVENDNISKTVTSKKNLKEKDIRGNKKQEEFENAMEKKNQFKAEETKESADEGWDWETWDDEIDCTEEKKAQSFTKECRSNEKRQNNFGKGSSLSSLDTLSQKIEQKQGNWNIGAWGVNMLLNKATAVTQGISNVLEAGLGAPDPETLARLQKEEEQQLQQAMGKMKNSEQSEEILKKNPLSNVNLFPVSGITNLVAGVTSKIVESTKIQEIGSKVLTGGLDTLETFGKKTMEVLQDGDPGLRNKRSLLMGNNKPVLSQILREAREKADEEIKQAEEKAFAKKCHFETLFDDFQGMVHLEALEMLSRQYELKLEQVRNGMSSEELEDLEGVLEEVEQLCALDDFGTNSSVLDFKTSLQMAVEPLKDEISVGQIIQIHENVNRWLQTSSELEPSQTTLHQKAVATVAELTAATVHQFHKAGELLSIKECRKTVDEVEALSKFTNLLCMEINKICEKFILMSQENIKKVPNAANTNKEKITVIRNNAASYIKEAFNLLIPVLQAGAAL